MALLERFGPRGEGADGGGGGGVAQPVVVAAAPSLAESIEYVRGLAVAHDENFSVLSSLVPEDLRDDFAAVYAFCRWADDLGDQTGSDDAARARSLRLLGWWGEQTRACWGGHAEHPVFVALKRTVERRALPIEPFLHLIDAFEQDQRVARYDTWEQLLDYCARSANPVGRIVLHLGGYPDRAENAQRYAMSDSTCTALQLINFWQDVRRDLDERDRVYLPARETGLTAAMLREWMAHPEDPAARVAYIRAVRPLVERTRGLFEHGKPLPQALDARLRPVVWLFGAGGMATLERVERIGCATLWQRPKLTTFTKARLVGRAWMQATVGRWMGSRHQELPATRPENDA